MVSQLIDSHLSRPPVCSSATPPAPTIYGFQPPLHKVIISIFQFSLLARTVGAILREFVLFRSRSLRADAAQTDFLELKYYLWRSDKVERQLGGESNTQRSAGCITPPRALP
jgi:hypothetical protein